MAGQRTRAPAALRLGVPAAWREDLRVAWEAFWVSRAVVWMAGLAAIAVWGVPAVKERGFDPAGLTRPFGAFGDVLVAPAARWDAVWFLAIAQDGYDDAARAAFFPLFPLLVHVLGLLGSPLLAAIAVSCACGVAGLAVVHRLALIEVGPEAARLAVLAMALFPGSLWFSAAYSESLFLLLSVGAVLAARTEHWAWAGLLGAGAAATRSAGVLLLVPLVLLWWDGRRRVPDLGWVALVPVGLAAFCLFLAADGQRADAPFAAQETWSRAFAGPLGGVPDAAVAAWAGVRQIVHGAPPPVFFTRAGGDPLEVARHNVMLFAFLVVGLVALAGAVRRLPLAHGAYAAAALALPLSYPVTPQPLMSLPRFLAVLYPLFLWAGLWLAAGGTWRRRVAAGAGVAGLAAFSALSSTWHWVA